MSKTRRDKLKGIFTGASSKIGPGSTIYSGLRTSLTLLKETADATELPVLRGAVGGLLKVVETIEKMSENQGDAVELLGYLDGLRNMLLNDTQNSKISDSMARRIEDLSREIAKIVHDIEKMKGRTTFARFIRSDTDASALAGHIQGINRLFLKFLLGSSVAVELNITPVVEGIDTIKQNVGKIGKDIEPVVEGIDTIKANVNKIGKDVEYLLPDGLPRVVKARFDGDKRQGCLQGTRVALLDTIYQWSQEQVSRGGKPIPSIFWLCGQAGTGKTTIASSIAIDCHDQGRLGASFFFSRDHSDRNDIRLVFPTLAHQLGTFCKEFKALLTRILQEDPDLAYVDPAYQLKKLIINPLERCGSFPSSTVVVIDALDECKDDEPISTLLSLLSNHLPLLPQLKFFITSRPENNVRLGFKPLCEITQSLILHDIEKSIVDADIELYLRKGFSTVSTLYPDLVEQGWPPDNAILSLVEKSWRLFIFAATALRFIMDDNYSDPTNQLTVLLGPTPGIESLSPSSPFFFLDQLYLQVLRQAFPRSTSSNQFTLIKMLLGTIVLLRNPLSPETLEDFLRLRRGVVRTAFRHLHSVIVVPDTDEHVIRLIHPSFFDFVTARCPDPQFRIDSTCHRDQLVTLCFEQMKVLKRDICEIGDGSKLNEEVEDLSQRVERHISPALRYACHHWVFHLSSAGESPLLRGMLNEFCRGQLLYWIEALSLTDSLRDGIRQIQALLNHFSKSSFFPEELIAILKDTVLFVREYFEVISCATLHLYRSALPLSPVSSPLRKVFSHELNGGVRVLQGERMGNHSSVTILRGHSGCVSSGGFSPDGTLVISASDDEVRLWDRGTGTLLKTFTMKSSEYSNIKWATFLPNGDRIISVTVLGFICTWDITTGVCVDTTKLQGVYEEISCSPDATHIVGTMGNNILLWGISDGYLLHTLEGHYEEVESVAFSPVQTIIASASRDQTIRLWDAVSGAALKTLTGHSGPVHAIAFSPCSKYLVSGSEDRDLRLWDSGSAVTLKIFRGHSGRVSSVAFSPDSLQVISGAWDNTLRVWDVVEGVLVKTWSVGEVMWELKNVGFSFDGTHYICTGDKDIYIWDSDRAADLDRSEEQLFNVQFSPDGNHLIAHIDGKSDIHLWDGLTGAPRKILQHPSWIKSLAFSPNSQYIASISGDNTIRIWDITSTTTLSTLTGHSKLVRSVAFSPDNTQIVSTSYDKTLRIWDALNGSNISTIEGNHHSAEFSPDGSQIIAKTSHSSTCRYDNPLPLRSHPITLNDQVPPKVEYLIRGGWIFVSKGDTNERCVWIPVDWREKLVVSCHGRVATRTLSGLVMLDLSSISLSI